MWVLGLCRLGCGLVSLVISRVFVGYGFYFIVFVVC